MLPYDKVCRKTIVKSSNFNIEKQYRIVYFYLRCKLNIWMLTIKVTSKFFNMIF